MSHCAIARSQNLHEAESRQRYDERRFEFSRAGAESLRLEVVVPSTIAWSDEEWKRLVSTALTIAERRLGLELRDDASIVFDLRPDAHNGLATVVPSERIYVHLEAPDAESSIALSRDYLRETLVHEFGHMLVLQQRRGLFSIASRVVGTASRPLGLWPKWMHEGLAVWTEGAAGGRPESGAIDFERRRFAEFARRTKRAPLENSDLDGSSQSPRSDPGDLPYHFGYLLLDHWSRTRKESHPFADFVDRASSSLGISYRQVFREMGDDLDHVFERAVEEWSATPLPPQAAKAKEKGAQARNLLGPFSNEAGLTWIEIDAPTYYQAPGRRLGHRGLGGIESRLVWNERNRIPLQFYATPSGRWILFARSSPNLEDGPLLQDDRLGRRFVFVLEADGRVACRLDLPPRLREIDFREGTLAWVRSEASGFQRLEAASLDVATCALGRPRLLLEGREAFERLSAPFVSRERWAVSRSRGRDTYAEEIVVDGEVWRADRALSHPVPADELCGRPCVLAQEHSRDAWTSVLVYRDGTSPRRLPQQTGSVRAALAPDRKHVWVRAGYWEVERLEAFGLADFDDAKAPAPLANPTMSSTATGTDASDAGPYSPWGSLRPRFWWPSLQSDGRGLIFLGQTFYQDLLGRWSGHAAAGFNSFLSRPLASGSLTRSDLGWGPFRSATLSADYQPIYTYPRPGEPPVQDRWGAGLSLHSPWAFPSGWTFGFTPSLSIFASYASGRYASATFPIPELGVSLVSPNGIATRLAETRGGTSVSGRARGLKAGPSLDATLRTERPFGPIGIRFESSYGWMKAENYPFFYYEWGGLPSLALYEPRFLSRGFAPQLAASSHVLRLGLQSNVGLWSPDLAFSWNRLRLRHVDLGFVGESVTSTIPGTRYALGHQFFTSAGVQLEIYGAAFQYVGFQIVQGVFYGFGPLGGSRYSLSLRSSLEI